MWTGTAGEQSTKHRGKGGGSTFPELPEPMAGVAALCGKFASQIWQIGRFQPQPQVQPQCALTHRSVKLNQSLSVNQLGGGRGRGDGEGEVVRGGGLRVWGSWGQLAWMDWTGLARRAAAAGAGTGTGTGRCARVGQEPCPSIPCGAVPANS